MFLFWVVETYLFLNVINFSYIFLQSSIHLDYFFCFLGFEQIILKYKTQMSNDFKVFFIIWKTKESTLWRILWKKCFWVQWLLEFRTKKFCLIATVKDYKLQKEQRSEETISNLKNFSSKYNTLLKILYWNTRGLASIATGSAIRYIHYNSISSHFLKNVFSKYICDLVLEWIERNRNDCFYLN